MLRAGLATAALGAFSQITAAVAGTEPQPALKDAGIRAIDTHAHYFPEAYLDVFNSEGKRFNAEFRKTDQGFFFKTPSQVSGPLPLKFIDLKDRIADMDLQGVAIQALSLTGPMVYWADGEVSLKLDDRFHETAQLEL